MEFVNPAEGWNGKHKIFKELIAQVRPKTIIEVGSWHGQSTITMAQACQELGLDTKIYCIDTWLGAVEFYTQPTPQRDLQKKDGYPQVYFTFLKNIAAAGVKNMIEVIPLPSNLAHKVAPSADLIYIDGSHEYEDVRNDIKNYMDKLNQNGIIFGDDYTNTAFEGVKKAVDEYQHEVIDNWYWKINVKNGIIIL